MLLYYSLTLRVFGQFVCQTKHILRYQRKLLMSIFDYVLNSSSFQEINLQINNEYNHWLQRYMLVIVNDNYKRTIQVLGQCTHCFLSWVFRQHKQPNCSHFQPLITLHHQCGDHKVTNCNAAGWNFIPKWQMPLRKTLHNTFTQNLCLLPLIKNVESRIEPPLSNRPGVFSFCPG